LQIKQNLPYIIFVFVFKFPKENYEKAENKKENMPLPKI